MKGAGASRPKAQAGFGLLEAIVAMVILGSAGLTLFAWVNQNLSASSRLKDAEVRASMQLEAQGLIETLNPARQPEGQQRVGALAISWRSELLEPARGEGALGDPTDGRWRIGLYRVTVQVRRADSGLETDWSQLVAGWKERPGAAAATPPQLQ